MFRVSREKISGSQTILPACHLRLESHHAGVNRMARTFLLACGIWTFLALLPSQSPAMTASKSVLEARDGVYLNPNTGRFWTMDSYAGSPYDSFSLHRYNYCEANPVSNIDPSGLFTQAFGNMAHDLIAGRYLSEHPGSIINPLTGVLGVLKPDIFNGPGRVYAEIKPLSFSGIPDGFARILVYDQFYGKLGFSRETVWPGGFQAVYVSADPIVYFNVDGIIFYSDVVDFENDLKQIKDESSAFRVMRGLLTKSFNAARDYARGLTKGIAGEVEADIDDSVGIASENATMGAE